MNMPGRDEPTASEQLIMATARAGRGECTCGETHEDDDEIPVPPATIGRIRGYITEHPGHQLAIDDDGTLAVIAMRDSGPPEVIAAGHDLDELLDSVGAPAAEILS